MKYYLNDTKYYPAIGSFLKSIGKAMSFYSTTAFILFCSYGNLGLITKFLPINGRILPYFFTLNLLLGISFTLIILILFT